LRAEYVATGVFYASINKVLEVAGGRAPKQGRLNTDGYKQGRGQKECRWYPAISQWRSNVEEKASKQIDTLTHNTCLV